MSPQDLKNLIPLRQVPVEAEKICPAIGRVHEGSAWRWTAAGVAGHRLKSILICRRRYTRPAWLRTFVEDVLIQDDERGRLSK